MSTTVEVITAELRVGWGSARVWPFPICSRPGNETGIYTKKKIVNNWSLICGIMNLCNNFEFNASFILTLKSFSGSPFDQVLTPPTPSRDSEQWGIEVWLLTAALHNKTPYIASPTKPKCPDHFCEKENSAGIQLSLVAGFVCDQFSSDLRTW